MAHWGWGQGHWCQRSQRILISVSFTRGRQFGIKTEPYPTSYRLQCWNTPGQRISKIGTWPHPSADRVPKAILRSQPPTNMSLDMALPTRGTRPRSTHQWASTTPSHQEPCASLRINPTHQRIDTRSKRSYNLPARRKETTNTES